MEDLKPKRWTSKNIDEHVSIIKRQIERSIDEGGVVLLARRVVSETYDIAHDPRTGEEVEVVEAWGRTFRAPPRGDGPPSLRDEERELLAIWNFVVMNLYYTYDPTYVDTFATAEHALKNGGSDCDEHVVVLNSMLQSVGFETGARVIATKDAPDDWAHIYSMVGLPKDNPKKWIPLDSTVRGATPGWEYPDIAAKRDYRI